MIGQQRHQNQECELAANLADLVAAIFATILEPVPEYLLDQLTLVALGQEGRTCPPSASELKDFLLRLRPIPSTESQQRLDRIG